MAKLFATLILGLNFVMFVGSAMAQGGQDADGEDADSQESGRIEEVTVIGSRIVRDGYESPTPVTVLSVENLSKVAPGNLADALNFQPQFLNSRNPNTGRKLGPQTPHGNFLDLRSQGSIRTLFLLDGVRLTPTNHLGTFNMDVLPELLLDRVEIVTAGASASYGSDAITGVVNFVLDKDFTGMKFLSQTGLSDKGDAFNYRVALAGGYDIGDRSHLLISVEHFEINGLLMSDRKSLATDHIALGSTQGGGGAGTAGNPLIFQDGVRWLVISEGGVVLSGPLAGTYFNLPGQARPYDFGTPTGSGGFSIGGDGVLLGDGQSVTESLQKDQIFARLSHDFNEKLSGYVLLMAAQPESNHWGPSWFGFGAQIFSGNPFIPAETQAILTETGTDSFGINKYWLDGGFLFGTDQTKYWSVMTGLDGPLGDRFSWKIDYVHGYAKHEATSPGNPNLRRLAAGVDAVIDPDTGETVCRVTLTNPGDWPGCVPINLLGVGAVSQAGLDYALGTSRFTGKNEMDIITATIQGDLFEMWAGPVSAVAGVEYREQTLKLTSNADPAVVRPLNGIRGIAESAAAFWFTNVSTASGKVDVAEIFAEVAVPLSNEDSSIGAFELNGAGRLTDYSTSGSATTWKFGATWRPFDDINFRVVRSHDIRAPTLFDLFSGATFSRAGFFDVHTNLASALDVRGGGNPELVPEIGDTLSIGFVFRPSRWPAFSLSVDYWDLEIEDIIANLSLTQINLDCEASNGTAAICDLIERPLPFSDTSAENFPILIRRTASNSSKREASGFDVEASYGTQIGSGSLNIRLLASFIDHFKTQQNALADLIDTAGYGTHNAAIPHLKAALTGNYVNGAFSLFAQERMIGKLNLGPQQVFAEPSISAVYYTDVTIGYEFDTFGGSANMFFTVNNLFDKKPPLIPGSTAPEFGLPTNALYDIFGRIYTLGVRFGF